MPTASLNGLVTMIWVILFFGVLAIYAVVFLILRFCNKIGPKILSEKENEVVAYVEYVPPSTDVEGQANIPVHTAPRTIFGKSFFCRFWNCILHQFRSIGCGGVRFRLYPQ